MPCPFFEPRAITPSPRHAHARLPLIDEYDGLCRARADLPPAPAERRFECCNHGYSHSLCDLFPAGHAPSCFRYTVLAQSEAGLEILCIEERHYAPVRWFSTRYSPSTGALDPDPAGVSMDAQPLAMRAQALAFCRSFLERFPLAS
ncbi:MAG: hypothetical protein JO340_07260 [Acidobacteriaceae bacterium]|nr:hypothetical protein [Acidobacteriaceae bacterium]